MCKIIREESERERACLRLGKNIYTGMHKDRRQVRGSGQIVGRPVAKVHIDAAPACNASLREGFFFFSGVEFVSCQG